MFHTKKICITIQKRQVCESSHVDKRTYISNHDIFQNDTFFRTKYLKRALIEDGVLYKCSSCDLDPIWNNKPLTLHVDHINGNRRDNRKANLRFLCPNCHQQTDTWGSKNKNT